MASKKVNFYQNETERIIKKISKLQGDICKQAKKVLNLYILMKLRIELV